jgi:hypothetical protein
MTLNLSFDSIKSIEFGVGRDEDGKETFFLVPVDENVQTALKEMVEDTWGAMREEGEPREYEASEKYASQEYVFVSTNESLVERLTALHRANLPINSLALKEPGAIFTYFAKLTDSKGRWVTAVRRATQFKGILKSRLLQFITDALKLVEDSTFKLDSDFDLLIDSAKVHILRPSGFEFIAELQEAIREAVPNNVASIQKDIPFVDFEIIGEYAASHTRAARHLASIRSQRETQNISQALLKRACKTHGVDLLVKNGKITVLAGSEMDFLDILDRRMYELELVEGSPERYRAGSRLKIGKK